MILNRKTAITRISEREYRSLKGRISYSNLRKLDSDREAFYKECVLGEKPREKKSASLLMGDMVHALLGLPGTFDEKFLLATTTRPTGQVGTLVDNLIERSVRSLLTNDEGEQVQQDSFEVIFSDALQYTQYDARGEQIAFKGKSKEKVLEMFKETGQAYYEECMNNLNRTVVTIADIEKAEKLTNKVKNHPYTEWYLREDYNDNIEVMVELPILYKIGDIECRSMPDRMIIDHNKKEILPVDYKTSWDVDVPENSFLKNQYYLQLAMYDYAIKQWVKEHGMVDYKVIPMRFIYIDTSGFNDPVILCPSKDDVERAWRGFTVRSYHYNGVIELIEQLQYHLSTGVWTTTKKIAERNGELTMKIPYGSRG